MAKRRSNWQGWGKVYRRGSQWYVRFYEPGAYSTFRLVKTREDKR